MRVVALYGGVVFRQRRRDHPIVASYKRREGKWTPSLQEILRQDWLLYFYLREKNISDYKEIKDYLFNEV